jgi:hypothetical protein
MKDVKFCLKELIDNLNNDKISLNQVLTNIDNYLKNASSEQLRYFRFSILQKKNNCHITYLDFIVKNIVKYNNNVITNVKLLYDIITKYIYISPESNKNLINHILYLNFESYQNIMYNSPNIDLNYFYSLTNMETTFSYLILFTLNIKKNTNINNNKLFWDLIDCSLGYLYNLIKYVERQLYLTQFIDNNTNIMFRTELTIILLNHKTVLNNFKLLTKEYFLYIDINKKITNPDYCRIYYNIFNLFNENHYRIQSVLFKNHNNYGLSETFIKLMSDNINLYRYLNKSFYLNSYLLLSDSSYIIHKFDILKSINYILENIKKIKSNMDWKHKYNNVISKMIDYFINSFEIINTYYKNKNLNIEINQDYYNRFIIEQDLFKSIINELPRILKIYLNKNIFEKNQIENLLIMIFRIYNNKDFKDLYNSNSSYNNNLFLEIWNQIFVYLEKENNHNNNELIYEKLVINGFKYQDLDQIFIDRIKKNPVNIMIFDKYASQSYQDFIKHLEDEFGDPITGEIIQTPLILPITKQIMEKNVIYKILLDNPVNPFNNLPLTIQELEEYNQTEANKKILSDFINKLKNKLLY